MKSAKLLISLTLVIFHVAAHAQPEALEVNSASTTNLDKESPTQSAPAKPVATNQAAKPKGDVRVIWYRPEVRPQQKKGFSLIRLSGKTVPKSKIRLNTDKIPLVDKKNNIKAIRTEKVTIEAIVESDERGNFEFFLNLPFFIAQIPINITTPKNNSRDFQVSLDVNKEDVRMMNEQNLKNSPYARRRWGLWGGLGYNYLKYTQETTSPSSIEFQSFTAPAYYGKLVRSLNKDWALQFTANSSPGKTKSSSAITVNEGDYTWTFLTLETTYFHPKWKRQKVKDFHEYGVQAGLQYHQVPFLKRTGADAMSVEENSILMAAFGGTWLFHFGRYWLLETFLRYQYPFSTGDTFDIKSSMTFDGSIGAVYKTKPNQRVGLFWYGQYHSYDFENVQDNVLGSKISGSQTQLFSDIELRFGIEFD